MSAGLAFWGTGPWICDQSNSMTKQISKSLAYGKTKSRDNANKATKNQSTRVVQCSQYLNLCHRQWEVKLSHFQHSNLMCAI